MTECCAQASVTFLGLARARGRSLTPGRSLQPKVNGGPHDWSVLGPMAVNRDESSLKPSA
jgi:hypothetical protein